MSMQPVASTNIGSVGHNPTSETMRVRFHMQAKSKGQYFAQHFRSRTGVRNRIKYVRVLAVLPSLFALSLQADGGDIVLSPTPFGFQCGMTTEQIIRLVGKSALKEAQGDTLILTAAPRPNPAFESYTLIVSPERGLLRMDGLAAPKAYASVGIDFLYSDIREAVSRIYGPPKAAHEDNSLGFRLAVWDLKSTHPSGISYIALDTGKSLQLCYECDGFKTYLASNDAPSAAVASTSARTKKPPKPFVPPPLRREWAVVKSWSGNGTKETEIFSVSGGEWRISWESRNEVVPATGSIPKPARKPPERVRTRGSQLPANRIGSLTLTRKRRMDRENTKVQPKSPAILPVIRAIPVIYSKMQ